MISLREVNDVDVHGDVVTCDVVTSVVTEDEDLIAAGSAATYSISNDGISDHLVHGNVIADHTVHGDVSDDIHGQEGLTLAQEQIVETSEDPIDDLFSVGYTNDIQPQLRVS